MRNSVAAAAILLAGCSAPHRTLTLVPTLPACASMATVNAVRVTAQGDFPPEATLTAAASPSTPASLTLPRDTRDVVVEGFGPTGLAAFGRTATLSLDDAASGPLGIAYGPPDGVCATGKLQVARAGHRATLLAGGAVLVTGGFNDGKGPAKEIELYDPRAAAFAFTGEKLDPRAVLLHTAVALDDGGALVAGGVGVDTNNAPGGIAVDFATRVDARGVAVGRPIVLAGGPRAGHSATRLGDGRVLLAGGCSVVDNGACNANMTLATTELYDPKSDQLSVGPPLAHARFGHDAVLRGDGTVLLVGGRGEGGGPLPAEIVDPDEARSFDAGVANGRAAALPTGSVLVAGGSVAPDTAASLWLSPTETLALPPLRDARTTPTVTALDDGAALIAGGGNAALALYDGRAALATLTAEGPSVRYHAAARLGDGTVLLTGGVDGGGVATDGAVVFFHSPLSPWASLPPLTLDGASDPYLPRRPDRASAGGGQLVVAASTSAGDGRPAELALVAGMQVADFTFDVLAGRRGAAGAALVVGWRSEASYAFVVVEPGRAVELWSVSSPRAGQSLAAPIAGCAGAALPDGALPDGDLAALQVAWRAGTLTVAAGGTTLLRCRPPPLPRGAVGVGALRGTAAFDNLALTR